MSIVIEENPDVPEDLKYFCGLSILDIKKLADIFTEKIVWVKAVEVEDGKTKNLSLLGKLNENELFHLIIDDDGFLIVDIVITDGKWTAIDLFPYTDKGVAGSLEAVFSDINIRKIGSSTSNHLAYINIDASIKVMFVNSGNDEAAYCLPLLKQLHVLGISSELYPTNAKIKKQMTYANNKGVQFVIMAGEDEMESERLLVKNMESGEQSNLHIYYHHFDSITVSDDVLRMLFGYIDVKNKNRWKRKNNFNIYSSFQ